MDNSTVEGMVWADGLQLLPPDPTHIEQGRGGGKAPGKWDIAPGDPALPDVQMKRLMTNGLRQVRADGCCHSAGGGVVLQLYSYHLVSS